MLGLLTDWIEVHGRLINLDRLSKIVSLIENEKVRRFWEAISQWQSSDERFIGTALQVPNLTLRRRLIKTEI